MRLIQDLRQVKFAKGLVNLYLGKLLLDFGSNIFGIFFPIFLYQQYKDINLVILYFIFGYGAYFLTLPWGAKLMTKIGIKNSLILSVIFRIPYFAAFYFFPENPLLYSILAWFSITWVRNLFWTPFHTESARLSDKKSRGKQFSILFSIASILSIVAPLIAGFILDRWAFSVVVVLSLGFCLLSIWPILTLPDSKEEFSWTYRETWSYFLHPFNRRMVFAYMSDGLVNLVNGVFWPLFIFSILNEKYQVMGLLTAGILFFGLVLRLFIGNLLDRWQKRKMVKVGAALNASAWFLKTLVVSGLQVFLVSTYHALALIVLQTSLNTLVYEKAADRGHYIDEYTVIKEMSDGAGRVFGLVLVAILLLFLPVQASFVVAGVMALFVNLLR
ncbi:MFS transporter [Candidatus Nomurabacteria bacterium]|nr:MFS transporter [Candidatus Nomurabacteria bacterium]